MKFADYAGFSLTAYEEMLNRSKQQTLEAQQSRWSGEVSNVHSPCL